MSSRETGSGDPENTLPIKPSESDQDEGTINQQVDQMLVSSLERLLSLLPDSEQQAIYSISIPHWFDKEFCTRLFPANTDINKLFENISWLELTQTVGDEQYLLHTFVREYLEKRTWKEQPALFRTLNEKAKDIFFERVQHAPIPKKPLYWQEFLYHQFICDEGQGLYFLHRLFEEAQHRYQIGLSEDYINQLLERQAYIGPEMKEWVQYYQARLDLSYQRAGNVEQKFEILIEDSENILVQGLSRWSLGDLYLQRNQWADAFYHFKKSLKILKKCEDSVHLGYLMLSIGNAHLDLANDCGGLVDSVEQKYGHLSRIIFSIQNLPFLFVEWLQQRISFFPRGWYAGTNYQDWIIFYLFFEAIRWYQSSERYFKKINSFDGLVDALLAQADIEWRMGRWAGANQHYDRLLGEKSVLQSPYRTAKISLGRGRLYQARKRPKLGKEELSRAVKMLIGYGDDATYAEATAWQGRVFWELGQVSKAVQAFQERLQALARLGDGIEITQGVLEAEELLESDELNQANRNILETETRRFDKRYYIARFPLNLLRWFRRMALLFALPLTYLLLILIGTFLTQALMIFEFSIAELLVKGHLPTLSALNIIILFGYLIIPIPLAMWVYRLIYSIAGSLFVNRFGKKLVLSERIQPELLQQAQPDLITVSPELITIENTNGKSEHLNWDNIQKLVTVDYNIFGRSIHLLSRIILLGNDYREHFIEGNTSSYERLKSSIVQFFAGKVEFHNLDFRIISPIYAWSVTLISILYALLVVGIGKVRISGGYDWQDVADGQELTTLWISSVAIVFVFTTLAIAPTGLLWRFYIHRFKLQRILNHKATAVSNHTLLVAAIFSTFIAITWIAFWVLLSLSTVVE